MKKAMTMFFWAVSFFYVSASMAGTSGPSGGAGGGAFSDWPGANQVIDEIRVRHGAVIDSVESIYRNTVTGVRTSGGHHGGWGGVQSTAFLIPGEYVTAVWGYYGSFDNALNFRTNLGNTYYRGNAVGAFYYYDIPAGSRLKGFKGRSGALLDAVGVNW